MSVAARLAALLCILLAVRAAHGQGERADRDRADGLASLARDAVFRDDARPNWIEGRPALWYRVTTGPGRHEYVFVDAEAGTRAAAFEHARLASRLSAVLGREIAPEALPIDRLEYDTEGNGLRFRVEGRRFRLDRASGELVELVGGPVEAQRARRGRVPRASRRTGEERTLAFRNATTSPLAFFWLDPEGNRVPYGTIPAGGERRQHTYEGHVFLLLDDQGKEIDRVEATLGLDLVMVDGRPRAAAAEPAAPSGARSPDGRWAAAIADHNVRLTETETGEAFALTTDGTTEDAYSQPIRWSPDSRRLVVLREKPAERHEVHMVESSPRDRVQPRLKTIDYLKAGDRIAHPQPCLFDVEARTAIPIADDLFPNPWSIDEVRWSPDSSGFAFLYNQRGHQVLRVVAVDAETGEARAIVDERGDTFVDYSQKTFSEWIDESNELIWMSERSGWNHLYLVDAETGAVKNPITRGEWVVREVERVDAERRQVWFWAMGIRPDQDPYHRHLVRVNLDGGGLTILTEGDGTHSASFSTDRRFFADTWSRVDQPPVTELRRADDGALVLELERADASLALKNGWPVPERFVAKGRDASTDIHGIIHRPTDFDATRTYPVVEQIYAGPHDFHVPKAWSTRPGGARETAELGFIVVQIDGMGTNWRSRSFHDVCWKNLKDAGFPDRIAWIKAAAESRPWMDLARVGIYGGSAGGQNAMAALLHHGEFYKVAAADCGCHDNRMDKIWWNEAWMGWPVGPEYAENSNVTHAGKLRGELLLIVGELDTNVDPASTMQVVDALVKADKDFDLLVIPGAGHGAAGTPYGRRRQRDFLVRHLLK